MQLTFTIAISILPRFFKSADGHTIAAVGSATESFGLFDYSFVLDEMMQICRVS